MLSKIARQLYSLIHKSKLERELDDELRFHLELETARNIRRGFSPEEAARLAHVSFGGTEQVSIDFSKITCDEYVHDKIPTSDLISFSAVGSLPLEARSALALANRQLVKRLLSCQTQQLDYSNRELRGQCE